MRSETIPATCAALMLMALASAAPAPSSSAGALPPHTSARVWAVTADADHGKILYVMHCKSCHGAAGWGDGPRAIPALAGQREKYLVEQLALFATGVREGQSMHEVMQRPALDWIQPVRDLAAYLSGATRSPGPELAGTHDLSAGKRLYHASCRDCHGVNGEGTPAGIPAIGGQHYRYLVAQLGNFAYGHRDAENQEALVSMKALSAQDIRDVANFASQLNYLTADGTR